MAGYYLYSIGWAEFERFIADPTPDQLLAFAGLVSDELDEFDNEIEEDDPVRDWPSEPAELVPMICERLARPDWYGDLSHTGKTIWARAVADFCDEACFEEMKYRAEGQVHWGVIDRAREHHADPRARDHGLAVSRFGKCPSHYHPSAGESLLEGWQPYHSMHPPEEVARFRDELRAAEATIRADPNVQTRNDCDELLPIVERIARDGRMLFVAVDT